MALVSLVHAMVEQLVEESLECLGLEREQPEQQSLQSTMVLGSQGSSPWYQVVVHRELELVAEKQTRACA